MPQNFSKNVRISASYMDGEVTKLLQAAHNGENREALDKLFPIVYQELRRLAGSFLNREYAASLQTTELVHEVYFVLTGQRTVDWENRGQFFAIAAQAMRRILIDAARRRNAQKRGTEKVSLDDAPTISTEMDHELIDLDNALTELAEFDPIQCRIVELRYFGGLSAKDAAKVLNISKSTVDREWAVARAWLYGKINGQ